MIQCPCVMEVSNIKIFWKITKVLKIPSAFNLKRHCWVCNQNQIHQKDKLEIHWTPNLYHNAMEVTSRQENRQQTYYVSQVQHILIGVLVRHHFLPLSGRATTTNSTPPVWFWSIHICTHTTLHCWLGQNPCTDCYSRISWFFQDEAVFGTLFWYLDPVHIVYIVNIM